MSNMMQKPGSYYYVLGIRPNASEFTVRAAYKVLALLHHPDKTREAHREAATAYFQELQEAYEYCLNRAQTQATVENAEDEDRHNGGASFDDSGYDGADWRGKLPQGIGGSGRAWWNDLTGDEPGPVKRWAKVCAKAERNARFNMTDTERKILNIEYQAAHAEFEAWHHIHIDNYNEEDRLQERIKKMTQRERSQAQAALDAKRSGPSYQSDDSWRDALDPEEYFDEWEAGDIKRLKPPTGDWRNNHNAASAKLSPQRRLAIFKNQIAALEHRTATLAAAGELEYRSKGGEKRRKKAHKATQDMLEAAIEEQQKVKAELAVKKAMKKGLRLENMKGVANPGLLEDELVDYERGKLQRIDYVPDSWEDED